MGAKVFCYLLTFLGGVIGIWIQGLTYARQVLYDLNYSTSPEGFLLWDFSWDMNMSNIQSKIYNYFIFTEQKCSIV
jgi:hypothetical protein